MTDAGTRHQVTRIRREPQRRTLTVAGTERLGAHMLRIRFTSDELAGFDSAAPDDHVKLLLPGADAVEGRPPMRDYTPRSFDVAAGTVVIDFALHEAGPATAWAMAAAVGDTLTIAGPRGSAVLADDFDWYLLVGDETAIPAIARRMEELRPGVPVTVLLAADAGEDRFPLPERPGATVTWSLRAEGPADDAARLQALLADPLPAGEGYVWIAAEAAVARALRAHVVETLGHPRAWTKASGYWTRGVADTHSTIAD